MNKYIGASLLYLLVQISGLHAMQRDYLSTVLPAEIQHAIALQIAQADSLPVAARNIQALLLTCKTFTQLCNDRIVIQELIVQLSKQLAQQYRWSDGTALNNKQKEVRIAFELLNNNFRAVYLWMHDNYEDVIGYCFYAMISNDNVAFDQAFTKAVDLSIHYSTAFSLLHTAIILENSEFIEKIILAGANVNSRNAQGRTPLSYALTDEIRELLIKHGARA